MNPLTTLVVYVYATVVLGMVGLIIGTALWLVMRALDPRGRG